MRIAFVSLMAGSPWAASEVLWAAAAQLALAEGHDVLVSTHDWKKRPAVLQALERQGAKIDLRPLSRWYRRSAPITYLNGTFNTLRRFKPDVICVSQGGTYDIARSGSNAVLRKTLDFLGAPYVLLCHCEQPAPPARNLEKARRTFAHAAIVGMVAARLQSVSELHLGVKLANVRIFHNPVNLRRIERLHWPASTTVRFAFVGRLDPVKNLESLIAALAEDRWRHRDWTLTVYGAGPDRDLLEQQVRQASLEDRIRFAGFVDDIGAVWAEHHALIMPSRLEGVPLAMVEAMLCGRPVVATDIGGIAEWLEEGKSGFLIRSPVQAEISAALDNLWNRREQMEELGRYAHEQTMAKRDSDPGRTLLAWLQQAATPSLLEERSKTLPSVEIAADLRLPDFRHYPPIARIADNVVRPALSVVIPTYEPQALLLDTLKSVLAQDPGAAVMQIAIIDDGSKAVRPASLMAGIAPEGRIEIHEHADNLGLAGNWNRAIAAARGRFVHILHQDDLVCEGFYAKLLAGLESSSRVGMAFSRHAFIDENGRIERISHREQRHAGPLSGWLDRISEAQRIQCPAAIVRREVYEIFGGFRTDLCYALDWEMWVRIAAHYDVWYEPEVLARYRRHQRTETARLEAVGSTTADTMTAIEMLSTHQPPARRESTRHRAYRRLVRSHLRRSAKLLEAGQPLLAIKQLDSARTMLNRLPSNFRTHWSVARLERLLKQAQSTTRHASTPAQANVNPDESSWR